MQAEAVEFGDPGVFGLLFRLWGNGLQAEHLAALLRAHCDAIGERVAVEVLERVFLQAFQGQVAVLRIPLQDPPPFQEAGHPPADGMEQVVELLDGRGWRATEAVVAGIVLYIHPVQKQHVEMDVQVQGRAEALDQGDRPSGSFLAGQSGLPGQVGGDRPGHDTQHPAHQLRVGGKEEAQRERDGQHPLADRSDGADDENLPTSGFDMPASKHSNPSDSEKSTFNAMSLNWKKCQGLSWDE